MVQSVENRKNYRFPAFSDEEGVKLVVENKRYLFADENDGYKRETKQSNRVDYANKSMGEEPVYIKEQLEKNREIMPEIATVKSPKISVKWETVFPTNTEASYSGPAITNTAKASKPVFKPHHKPSIMQRETKRNDEWIQMEERIDKSLKLEEKLAGTRFAEPAKKPFKPKNIPQQLYGNNEEDFSQRERKFDMVKQIEKRNEDMLLIVDEAEAMDLPELKDETVEVTNQVSTPMVELETFTKEIPQAVFTNAPESADEDDEVVVRTKRKIPQVTHREFGSPASRQTLNVANETLDVPAIQKKKKNPGARLEKSLSGIMSEEGSQQSANKYFD